MRADLWFFALLGLANASELISRQDDDAADYDDDMTPAAKGGKAPWKPKTNHPEFFSLKVDQKCDDADANAAACALENYAIRLERGILIATPYNKWWDPKLPIFFVDDDSRAYTVSKNPLQLYVDSVTGAMRYSPVGWLPPNAIALSFYHTGTNPLGMVDPSPAYFSWPLPSGLVTYNGITPFWLCPLGTTGQYQIFIAAENFPSAGVIKSNGDCTKQNLAAVNANPWKKSSSRPQNGGRYGQ
ncbi:Nn.00g071130.m01.CDS01 [Neocucurbitaria sp. VM-36]